VRHRGQHTVVGEEGSSGTALAPQWEQNFSPANIIPKQHGQATVASCAPQCAQLVVSVDAGAPHMGQLSVSAGIDSMPCLVSWFELEHNFKLRAEKAGAGRGIGQKFSKLFSKACAFVLNAGSLRAERPTPPKQGIDIMVQKTYCKACLWIPLCGFGQPSEQQADQSHVVARRQERIFCYEK
jgi:hypothetical protein